VADSNETQRSPEAEDHYFAAIDAFSDGNLETAVESYRRAIALDATYTDAMHGLSRALQDLGRFDEAIEVSKRIAEVDPEDVLAYTSLSILYQHKGLVPEAEEWSTKAKLLGWRKELQEKKNAQKPRP
jgi:tetratricopeptide (TPR) repeat protein